MHASSVTATITVTPATTIATPMSATHGRMATGHADGGKVTITPTGITGPGVGMTARWSKAGVGGTARWYEAGGNMIGGTTVDRPQLAKGRFP